MSRRRKLTDEERIQAVKEYLDGKGSCEAIAEKYGITFETFRQTVIFAKTNGIESIRISHKNKRYSAKIKLKAVTDYLSGKGSQTIICAKYGIKSKNVLQQWIGIIVVKTLRSTHAQKEELP